MRYPRLLLAAIALLFIATGALAQTPSLTITPNQFYLYSAEEAMDLQTNSVFGSDHNDLVFSGPDSFTLTIDGSSSNFLADVTVPNTYLVGAWSLTVNAFDTPAGPPRPIGPATIMIVERPQTDPPLLNIPDGGITAAATSLSIAGLGVPFGA